MKKFLLKIGAIILLLTCFIHAYILLLTDNYTDSSYYKFTTGRYKSLVLGTSRVGQGIEPKVLNRVLGLEDNRIYNYAFTVKRSVWGEPYFNSIKRKLRRNGRRYGIFILECNPWAMCSKKEEVGRFVEIDAAPNNIIVPNLKPNIEYFFGGYGYVNFQLLVKKFISGDEDEHFINDDGRYVVDIPYDSMKIPENVHKKIKVYEEMTLEYVPDSTRMHSLVKTIKYLKQFGSVYLIRMPVAEEMAQLETSFYPEFNEEMNTISNDLDVAYLDFNFLSNKYVVADGNHIHNNHVVWFNELLASKIMEHRLNIVD